LIDPDVVVALPKWVSMGRNGLEWFGICQGSNVTELANTLTRQVRVILGRYSHELTKINKSNCEPSKHFLTAWSLTGREPGDTRSYEVSGNSPPEIAEVLLVR
jgi:hypothetical protein